MSRDPEAHIIDENTGLTATGPDHRGGEGFTTERRPSGVPATLDRYTLKSGAVGSTPVKHDPRTDT